MQRGRDTNHPREKKIENYNQQICMYNFNATVLTVGGGEGGYVWPSNEKRGGTERRKSSTIFI